MGEQFATFLLFCRQRQPADRLGPLVPAVVREHEPRHDQSEGESQHDNQPDRPPPPFDSVCSDSRARAGPPRIATKKTPRPASIQKARKA